MKLAVGLSARFVAVIIMSTLIPPHKMDENSISAR